MNETIKDVSCIDLLGCPDCKQLLSHTQEKLLCSHCNKQFRVEGGLPIFLDDVTIEESAVKSHQQKSTIIKKVVKFLKPPHHSVYMDTLESSYHEGKTLIRFLDQFNIGDVVLNIGSLSKKIIKKNIRVLNLDISIYPNIDIIADAHYLPFRDETLDGIIIKNVFEHLRDPAKVRNELKRVLKKGGKIYAKIPFMQPFHAVPDDYQRYTINGIKEFFKDFVMKEEGISVGPSSALAWYLREYFGILFSFNTEKGYKIARAFFSYITAPVKYFDAFFRNKREAHRLASAFYIILEK